MQTSTLSRCLCAKILSDEHGLFVYSLSLGRLNRRHKLGLTGIQIDELST